MKNPRRPNGKVFFVIAVVAGMAFALIGSVRFIGEMADNAESRNAEIREILNYSY